MSKHTNKALHLSEDELLVINNSINEVLHGPDAIEDWEFQTRIGVERQSAEQVLEKIKAAINAKVR